MRRFSMLVVCLGFHSIAFADDTVVATTTPAPDPATASAAPPMAASAADDGMRLRNGFSLSASHEFGSGPSSGLTGQLFGADWRIGVAIDDLHAVYLQSHISFGNAKIGNAEGVTGNLAVAVMGERLLPQRIFVAGGGG